MFFKTTPNTIQERANGVGLLYTVVLQQNEGECMEDRTLFEIVKAAFRMDGVSPVAGHVDSVVNLIIAAWDVLFTCHQTVSRTDLADVAACLFVELHEPTFSCPPCLVEAFHARSLTFVRAILGCILPAPADCAAGGDCDADCDVDCDVNIDDMETDLEFAMVDPEGKELTREDVQSLLRAADMMGQ